jgi:isoquinoline 1-oxidoreductase beta subunit
VRITQAPVDKIYANLALMRDNLPFHPDDTGSTKQGAQWLLAKVGRELGIMFTGGSTSVKDAWQPMREAGAVARALLVRAACDQWQAKAADCRTEDGVVIHADGRRAGFASLAHAAAGIKGIDTSDVKLKEPVQFRLIGKPAPRRDSPAKANGSAVFGIDVRPQGMVYAAVKMAPVLGATVGSFDAQRLPAMPGVIKVVDISHALNPMSGAGAGVAVVASTWWQARQAAAALPVSWNDGQHGRLSNEAIFDQFRQALDKESGFAYHERGSMDAPGAARTVSAEYQAPFLAHTPMEPINCTAQVANGRVRLWASTQVPSIAVEIAAKVAGVSRDDVTIDVPLLGGGFGRRLETDMVAQAVAVAMATAGKPVQLIWTREDDIAHDVYRPAALARYRAALDVAGKVIAWESKSASGAIGHQYFPRNLGLPGMGPDKTTAEGEFDMPYEFANQRVAHVIVDSAVPIGYWRSVGHSHNAFFKESFIEEVAQAAGKESVAFRRELLARHPRHLAVLDAALAKAGQAAAGRAHGVALHLSFGSILAELAEVSVQDKEFRVHRVVCAFDCGIVVNPNIVAQQMESAVVYGLTAALMGEITIKDGRVQQTNFGDYPALRIDRAPQVETVIVPSAEPPEGVGEPGLPPIAPAVAAAVFKLTGQRLRSLPLRLA